MNISSSRKFPSNVWCIALGFAASFIAFCSPAQESVTLAWNAETNSSIAGYVLYAGTNSSINSSNYTTRMNTGTNTSATVPGLKAGLTYYFAATAYNSAGVESPPSSQVSYLVPGIVGLVRPSKSGSPMTVNFPVAPGHSYTVQASVDLRTWTNLWQMGTSTSNVWVNYQDSNSSSMPKRFYRVISTP